MNTPNFSVLLSVYKKEKPEYLSAALKSIWDEQTVKPSQIILIKDGPLPTSLNTIINEFTQKAPVKEIYNENNIGLSASLNKGVIASDFELIARMDTDDIAYPDRFEKQLLYFQEHPEIDILGGYANLINEEGEETKKTLKYPTSHDEIKKYIWTSPFAHPSVMYKKSSILRAGNYEIPKNNRTRHDDYELWFRCAYHKLQFANMPIPLIYYRFITANLKRNNVYASWMQFKVGIRGCYLVHASPLAYIGVVIPFVRSLLPYPLNKYFQNAIHSLNPRNRY